MSREEAHNWLDRLLDLGFKGAFIFNFTGTGIGDAYMDRQKVTGASRAVVAG